MIGTTLSQYRIDAELGRGGMGIVYRATDTKLNRTVALKVLPAAALASEDDRARFFREAQAAAQLHHPNIATVFQIDEAIAIDATGAEVNASDGPRPFIAMEFIEGETLQEIVKQGPMKLPEAVRIAAQIAEALKAAHAKQIVHRDIKSANVMLTPEGIAKVLDFGLAKTNQSTMLTRMGSTLGTIAYMSPEQARGQEVDGRSDLYSLGTVLYEMLAGRLPFAGEYEQAVVYSILNEIPEALTAVRTGVPMGLEWIVNKLMSKEPRHRYQTAADLVADLETVDLSGSGQSRRSMTAVQMTTSMPSTSMAKTKPWALIGGVAAGAVLVGLLVGYFTFKSTPEPQPLMRVTIDLPGVQNVSFPTLSPTKEFLAFYASGDNGQSGLFLRYMGSGAIRFISEADISNNREIVFSPTGDRLAYTDGANGGVYTVVVPTGLPERQTETGRVSFWEDDNTFVYVNDVPGGEAHRKTIGVEDAEVISLDQGELAQGYATIWKTRIPGSGIAFGHQLLRGAGVQAETSWLVRAILSSGKSVVRVESPIMNPEYVVGGFLAYQQRNDTGTLVVRPVDASTGEFAGPPREALADEATAWALFSVSRDGDLLYITDEEALTTAIPQPFLVDFENQSAEILPMVVPDGTLIRWPDFSPDGSQMAVSIRTAGENDNLVLYDVVENTLTQITFGVDTSLPNWSADGNWIYYSVETEDSVHVFRQPPNASARPERVQTDGWMGHVSPDGRYLAFIRDDAVNRGSKLMLLDTETKDVAVVDSSSAFLDEVRFSPDGRYLAYSDFAGGRWAIRVAAVEGLRISEISDVFGHPRWSNDGKYLFVAGRDAVRIPVRTTPSFTVLGESEPLYFANPRTIGAAILPDGKSGVVIARGISFASSATTEETVSQVIWLQNWSDHLKREFAR